jgi:hypothetical protein
MIVGTFRPAELLRVNDVFLRVKLELQGHGVCRELAMPLLTRRDVGRYLALQFAGHRFPEELAARIHRGPEAIRCSWRISCGCCAIVACWREPTAAGSCTAS